MAKRIQRQLKKQLEEQKSLEEELDKLQSAKNPKDSCQEVIKFVQSTTTDPIDDTENNPFIGDTCFVAGTEILVNKLGKHKKIEELQIGDVVMCLIPTHMSFKESIEGYKIEDIPKLFTEASVTNIYASLSHHICNIKFRSLNSNEERTVECTESHPIYVNEQGWKTVSGETNGKERYDFEIQKLQVGDNVCLENGELACITHIHRTSLRTPVPVYNLTVSQGHTFFANGLFVHNKCPCVIL